MDIHPPRAANPFHPPRHETLEDACIRAGMRMTEQRRLVTQVIDDARDHPDVLEIYDRATRMDPHISVATVYRTVKALEDVKLIVRHRFDDGPARFERASLSPHDHLIDVQTGRVIEFRDPRIDAIQARLAEELGYRILSYRLEIFAAPVECKAC